MVIVSFLFFLFVVTSIGIYASRKSRGTTTDYIVASRSVGPVAVALSAIATAQSGFMFIGMIGFTYVYGISVIWLPLCWVTGEAIAWLFGYKRLRTKTAEFNVSTLPSFISYHDINTRINQVISGSLIVIFLCVYAAAQLTAGSKTLSVMLGWPNEFGVILATIVVMLYSLTGGVRALIWADVAQSVIMFMSMLGLMLFAVWTTGGFAELFIQLESTDPALVKLIPQDLKFGFPLFLAAWVCTGIGALGQPHIVVRPMSIDSPENIKKSRWIYLGYYLVFSISAVFAGLAIRILIPDLISADPEMGFPLLAQRLLPAFLVGLILAGIFAATISTADSQVLTCSAAITQDINVRWKENLRASHITTLLVMSAAALIAIYGSSNVFILAIRAYSALGAVLMPLVLLKCYGVEVGARTTTVMMLTSFCTIIIWADVLELNTSANEILPGVLMSLMVFGISRLFRSRLKKTCT